jgi:hypothetical protein
MEATIHIFAGPTLDGLNDACAYSASWHPPIRRNELDRFTRMHPVSVIAIVDGTFHDYPAVGHKEIINAIEQGWEVWGLSSMGAIRAYELRHDGMKGFGRVYSEFCAHEDFQDDEVTLLHLPEAPYTAVSEPMIHIRIFLNWATDRGLIAAVTAEDIAHQLKSSWFGYRTLGRLCGLIKPHWLGNESDLMALLRDFRRFRQKTTDLQLFLANKPWLEATRETVLCAEPI